MRLADLHHFRSSLRQLSSWEVSFTVTSILFFAVLLVGELKSFPWKNDAVITCLVMGWIVYSQTSDYFKTLTTKLWRWGLYASISLLIFYIALRFVNVYALPKYDFVQNFCQQQALVCQTSVKLFFFLKFYRFITVSIVFLLSILFFFQGLWVLSTYGNYANHFINRMKRKPLLGFAMVYGCVLFLSQSFYVSSLSFDLILKTWENRQLSFADRFVPYEFGIEHHGWIWVYGKFINAHVPEEALIYIPPQSDIWPQEGNKYYFRWFVYPRNLVNFVDPHSAIPSTATHVLISRGGWHGKAAGWPKKTIKSECIAAVWLINRHTLHISEVVPADLENVLRHDDWGVIKLNKERGSTCQ